MGLIIHPSSCCDVCLEVFTYDEPKPPHAIPCGHIFCKDCLRTVNPRTCPLCRKSFIPERSKKLITGELPPAEAVNEVDLLKRLVISWDLQEEELVVVTTEVERWLQGREETPTILPLRKAWEALRAYHKLRTQTNDDRRTIRHLKREIRATIDEKNTANAIGQSLNAQIDNLQIKVFYCEAEIQGLRLELSKFKSTKNPLPAPPEPVSLDRVPTSSQTASSGSKSYQWPPPDLVNSSDESAFHHYASEGEDAYLHSREPGMKRRDRKGKGKARDDRERPAYGTYHSSEVGQNNPTVNGATTTVTNTNRNAIIPGATPTQRVIPMRKTAFEDLATQTSTGYMTPPELKDQRPVVSDSSQFVDLYTLTAGFVSGYPDGYIAGYQAGMNPTNREANSYPTWGTGAVPSSSLNPPPGTSNHSSRKHSWVPEVDHTTRYPTTSYPNVPPLSAPPQAGPRNAQNAIDEQTRPPRIRSPLSAPDPTSIAEGSRPPWDEHSRSTPLQRHPATSSVSSAHRPDAHENGRPHALTRRSAMIVRNPEAVPTNDNGSTVDDWNIRNSISSWGTVDSENPPISVSDLPLHSDFSRGARASMQSLLLRNTFDPPSNGVTRIVNEDEIVDRQGSIITPRIMPRAVSSSDSVSTARPLSTSSHTAERPRDRRVASNPAGPSQIPFSLDDSRYAAAISSIPEQTSDAAAPYRTSNQDHVPFSSRQLPAATPVDGTSENGSSHAETMLWTGVDASDETDGNALGLLLSQPPDNALGLQLNQSPQISAPTPIFPSRAFLRSFSDNYY